LCSPHNGHRLDFHHIVKSPFQQPRPTKAGGWVNNSEPEAEFQEMFNQSRAMLTAVALAESFAKV